MPTTWKDKLSDWLSGKYQRYPKGVKSRFFYKTAICTRDLKSAYLDEFVETKAFDNMDNQMDYSSFAEHIKKNDPNQEYALAFKNIAGTSVLVIPVPKRGKNFLTIKDFMDNASITQQTEFWKFVAIQVLNYLTTHNHVFISTHGLGVPYFHLRLDPKPKYYHSALKHPAV